MKITDYEIVGFGRVLLGDWFINQQGKLTQWLGDSSSTFEHVIVKQKEPSVKVTLPEGYELACDLLRPVKKGEYFFNGNGASIWDAPTPSTIPKIILKVKWVWPAWVTSRFIYFNNTMWCRGDYLDGEAFSFNRTTFTPPPDVNTVYENPTWNQ